MVRFPWRKKREQNAAQQQTHIDTESWAEKDAKVEVTQPKGFFTKVRRFSSIVTRCQCPKHDEEL